jgi:ABC-type antimicrobial peptide transport system permease subunit
MRWRDAVWLALRSVLRRPGRAVLTVAAVALASALLTALLTMARTAETRVLGELSKGGPLAGITVAAAQPDPTQIDSDNPRPGVPRNINDNAIHRIAALPNVKSVVPIVNAELFAVVDDPVRLADGGAVSLRPGTVNDRGGFGVTLVGADLGRSRELPLSVLAGRLPIAGSLTEVDVTPTYLARLGLSRREAARIVGTEVELGSPRAFGDGSGTQLRGRWTRAEVVGVVAQQASGGDLVAPIQQAQAARQWTLGGVDGGQQFSLESSPYSGLFVVADGLDKVASVRVGITNIGFSSSAPENLIASVQRYLHVVEIVLSGIGVIALVIASLGITNALLAAIRERRREIGVLKAIGARDSDVLRVFLFEAGVLGLAGGLCGTLLGFLIAQTVAAVVNGYLTSQGLVSVRLGIPGVIVAGGIGGAALLALVAGALPAWRAAHLPAREAVDA